MSPRHFGGRASGAGQSPRQWDDRLATVLARERMVQKWQGKTVAVDWMSRSAGASVEQGWAVEGFGGREFLMNGSFADVVKEVAGRLGDVGWDAG